GNSPFLIACFSGNEKLVHYFIHEKEIKKFINLNGDFALMKACTSGNINLVQFLIEKLSKGN
ncbi:hypothetical protein U3516DRAFT_560224, partial [Neocallimastix sp. 'constans']